MFEFNITGMQDAINGVKKPVDRDKIKDILIKGGLAIEAEAKDTARVDTGRLRASYSTNWDDSGMAFAPVKSPAKGGDGVSQPTRGYGDLAVVRVGTNVEYAVYIEYGTLRHPGYFTLTNAAMKIQPLIVEMLKVGLNTE